MRPTSQTLKAATKSVLARKWKPRPLASSKPMVAAARHPERFVSQIVLSDGSSFRVRSTAPRDQVKITKDTRSHPLWNPQMDHQIDDEGGYLATFQKKFQGFGDFSFSYADKSSVKEAGAKDASAASDAAAAAPKTKSK
ncbi:hypothetical protein IW140_004230 [Coemansia sp. RSA 1813]|nr:hypothetical protein EV178_004331 [Coemansia sp. RSA 1646]KAJ1769466.1 hypothetical protein LPJ74_004014 [Coemansia sp. RSA 1843]KAJ2088083.1 hypothetical protein IW138_004503 [Coemansia sp. RSA 986]KAJ2214870.1 hypothetical protein EV179_002680 [Coemansia sp. RSA 487]KAJ2568059.1 hypothetical protein IW140_004230 [Coemansia sp. RSA 1813]